MNRSLSVPLVAALALCAIPLAARAETYVRAGAGFENSSHDRFRDVDCNQSEPPALFGCAVAVDGQPLAARGDFGTTPTVDLGLGWRLSPYVRVEVEGTYRPSLNFGGQANFLRTPGEQPVSARGHTLTALAVGWLDLGTYGRLRPFLGLGLGVSRNHMGAVRYDFPGLAQPAATITSGGSDSQTAWMASAGVSWPLSRRATLDVAYRYTDLGDMRTDAGPAAIVRSTRTIGLDIAPTHAALVSQGVSASVRWAF